MYLDALLTPGRVEELSAQHDAVLAAYEQLGLTPEEALAIGSAGMAVHDLYGHSPQEFGRGQPFDVDLLTASHAQWRVLRSHPEATAVTDYKVNIPGDSRRGMPQTTLLG